MHEDLTACRGAVRSRDRRFDGWFVTGVLTTGIYCRPSCPARTPAERNMRFYPTAAAAQAAGFRACKRCLPDAVPGSPSWSVRGDVVARAMRLIADGVVDRDGVPGLAARLGYSTRQLDRIMSAEVGAGPLALARAQRARTARLLVETTAMPMSEVALASGFASLRSFNETFRDVFALAPTAMRATAAARRDSRRGPVADRIRLRLPFRAPLLPDNLFGHLAATAVPGVEQWHEGAYRRTLRLPHGHGVAQLRPPAAAGDGGYVECTLALADLRDLTTAIARCRRLLDLDADPVAVDEALAADPVLAPLVAGAPGRRVPGTVDPDELAVRAVLGQQVSTAAARTHAARLVLAHGTPVPDGAGLTHLFPTAAQLADLDPRELRLPQSRRRTLTALVTALASGAVSLDAGCDREEALARLLALPGIGPWTAGTVAMRALGDTDAFLPGDLGVRQAAQRLGLPADPRALEERSARWRPWRAYAVQHLWATGDHAVNRLPSPGGTDHRPVAVPPARRQRKAAA